MALILFAFQIGCSTYVERTPANNSDELFTSVFSFVEMQPDGKENLAKDAKDKFKHYENYRLMKRKFEYLPSKQLPKGVQFKVELDIDQKNSEYIFRVLHAENAFKDKASTYAMYDFIEKIVSADAFASAVHGPFETYFNAQAGDPNAIEAFFKIRGAESYYVPSDAIVLKENKGYLDAQKELEKKRILLSKKIKELSAQRKIANDQRKIGLDALDKAPEADQFRAKIAKGDRKGAMSLLKKYLPWEDMAPFEKQFWETYIDVVLNPVPTSERVLIYRGLDDDYIHRGYKVGKELTEKEAIAQSNAFVMSSVMVKNQGSWNRRLRSLEAMNGKFIGTINGNDEFAKTSRITTMFLNHSADPKGSPFLSFSPNYSIAENFGSHKVSAYLIDPRMLSFNYASTFENEIEYLIPLSTWPDELVGIVESSDQISGYGGVRKKILEEMLEKKIAKEYGEGKKEEIIRRIRKNSFQFFKGEYKEMTDVTGNSTGPSNLKFFQQFYKPDDPKPVLTSDGELSCKDLVELFWKVK